MSMAVTATGTSVPASSQSKVMGSAKSVSMAMLSVAVMLSDEARSRLALPAASRYSVVSGKRVAKACHSYVLAW